MNSYAMKQAMEGDEMVNLGKNVADFLFWD